MVRKMGEKENLGLLSFLSGGQKIELRLRRPNDLSSFFELESLLDTMLHELSHIVHHNHSAAFYDLWEELRKELSANMSRGLKGSGAGFDAKGARVNPESRNPSSLLDARQRATEAAEKRFKMSQLFGSGPQKLGGSSSLVGLGEAEAVRRATMKRCSEWCGNHEDEKKEEIVDAAAATASAARVEERKPVVADEKNPRPEKMARIDSKWSCEQCTFDNEECDRVCAVCERAKVCGKTIFFCFVFDVDFLQPGWWLCPRCSAANSTLFQCATCDARREIS